MNRAATLALTPLGVAYGIVVGVRNSLYRAGILKIYDVGLPVISVGNLTTGGTGKTPLVGWLATQLAAEGRHICILSRGYRRQSSHRLLVSNNDKVLSDVRSAGDEPFLLAQQLVGKAAVICDKDRVSAAQWAKENLETQVFVLDDAFQHQRIKRTLNILLVDATNPFGNGRLLPAGNLREPASQIKRADCIVITRSDETAELDRLRAYIEEFTQGTPIFNSRVRLANIRPINGTDSTTPAPNQPLAAFCGIANPNSFLRLLRKSHHHIVHTRIFRDHYNYQQSDADEMTKEASAHGATAVIATEKDAVKLASLTLALPCYSAGISIEFDQEKELLDYVKASMAMA
ncbi:MAG TPA: tetraacyldisaccharide 4'-kinase [Pyrinomonadaceae bacterium]|nr:tetraacyldisaccharide 4'-kinase [Pyrinomonadaceae bacterium]